MATYVDTCQDGVRVGTNENEDFVYFNLAGPITAVATPDWGSYTRAAAFGNTHVAACKANTTDRCLFVRETGQVVDIGPSVGTMSQVLMPSPDRTILYLLSMETITQYRKVLFDPTFAVLSSTLIDIPAGQTYTEGFLDCTIYGEPIFTSSRRELTVQGTPLIFPVERNGVWLGQDGSGTDNILLVSPDGTVTIIYAGLAFEPHLTLSNDGTTLYISFRQDDPGPDGELGQFSSSASGGILQALYVPKSQPYLNSKNTPTKPWLDFFDRIARFIGQPVNLAQVGGILDPANGGTGNNSGGGQASAPIDAEYIVAAANAMLTAERVATDTPSIVWNFATAGQAKATVVAYWIPLVDGSEPPVFITDGAGHLILVAVNP